MSSTPRGEPLTGCPDGGHCHHDCALGGCFRVLCCVPFSDVGKWPVELVCEHQRRESKQARTDIERHLVATDCRNVAR